MSDATLPLLLITEFDIIIDVDEAPERFGLTAADIAEGEADLADADRELTDRLAAEAQAECSATTAET